MSNNFKILEDKCNGCGLCIEDCPTGSIKLATPKLAEIDSGCVSCGVCFKTCNRSAIVIEEIEERDTKTATCSNCPVFCQIPPGKLGACKRYENKDGVITRNKPLHIVKRDTVEMDKRTKLPSAPLMLGVGAGTNLYTTNVPARYVVEDVIDDVEVVTSVTESVLSFSGVKLKIDTDENIGLQGSKIKFNNRVVGYVTASEYGSRTLYIGGVELLAGKTGFAAAKTMTALLNGEKVVLKTESVNKLELQVGKPPIIDGKQREKMRVGCGSVVVGGFALDWLKVADEVIAVDYDITALFSQHPSAARFGTKATGVIPKGSYSTPGRYFGTPGEGWGGSDVMNGREAIASINKDIAWPGMKIVVTEPTADNVAYFVLDDSLELVEKSVPPEVQGVIAKIRNNCESCLTNVIVVGGVGGGVRGVLSKFWINVNRALREGKIMVTVCGQPTHILPGGNIIIEADVSKMMPGSFAWVPTPAMVVPVEFTMTKETYLNIDGYGEAIKRIEEVRAQHDSKLITLDD